MTPVEACGAAVPALQVMHGVFGVLDMLVFLVAMLMMRDVAKARRRENRPAEVVVREWVRKRFQRDNGYLVEADHVDNIDLDDLIARLDR